MRLLDSLHRWTGGIVGLLLAVLGLTGLFLVHRDSLTFAPHAGDVRVTDMESLAATTQHLMTTGPMPQSITYASDDFGLLRLAYKGGKGAYADQAGALVMQWDSQWQRPELWLFDLHHHLFMGEVGDTVIGLAALCGLFFVVTGVLLWWRTRKTFAFRLWPARMSRSSIVRHHRDLGIVVAPLLLLSLMTGAILIFRPMTAILFGPGAPAQIDRSLAAPPPRVAELGKHLDWAAMIRTAHARFPDAQLRSLSPPRKDNGLITIRMKRPPEWLPNGRTTLWFAADTGALVDARDAAQLPGTVRGYNMLYPLHAAKVGGLAYRLVMSLSGLAMALLGTLAVWSFWFKRPRKPAPRR